MEAQLYPQDTAAAEPSCEQGSMSCLASQLVQATLFSIKLSKSGQYWEEWATGLKNKGRLLCFIFQ